MIATSVYHSNMDFRAELPFFRFLFEETCFLSWGSEHGFKSNLLTGELAITTDKADMVTVANPHFTQHSFERHNSKEFIVLATITIGAVLHQ